ncbi:mitochondrial inner membrane protease subunit 2-like [Mya arenaria]|uniref:mitochondrial inner membrane protease subunit 2-like n=1 Tax=Mya arenaria TaxID=6604 RepID=UPI0022E92FAE|nr:mitochondrial inner membrane protease subunit 2-like [Mya arenaria]XP_052780714.1 mitochondrial inner membrane protease subunit 2-like [Mya arenaria]
MSWKWRSLKVITFLAPVTLTFIDTVGHVSRVEGVSMQPCFNPEVNKSLDYVWLNIWSTVGYQFKRGDIVTLRAPYNPKNTVIKRIIALEGDSVSHVNSDDVWVRVPRGQCWVEGDNPRFSKDSNSYGPVPLGLIQAKATHIVWPPRRWCKLNSSNNEYSLPPDRVMPNHITSSHNDYNGRPCTTVI